MNDPLNFIDRNSLGEPLANTADELLLFWQWFNGSLLVDDQGRPIPVYHGGHSIFSQFEKKFQKKNSRLGKGFYFTTSVEEARNYGPVITEAYLKIDALYNGRTRQSLGNGPHFGLEYSLLQGGGRVFVVDKPSQILIKKQESPEEENKPEQMNRPKN